MKLKIKITALIAASIILLCFAAGCAGEKKNDYINWTYSDWSDATDVEKLQCSAKYIEALDIDGESAMSAKSYVFLIEMGLFQNPGITVGGLAEIARDVAKA